MTALVHICGGGRPVTLAEVTEENARRHTRISRVHNHHDRTHELWTLTGWCFEPGQHVQMASSLKEAKSIRDTAPIERCAPDCDCLDGVALEASTVIDRTFAPGETSCEGCENVRKLHAKEDAAKALAAERRKRPFIFEGVDLRAELRRFCRLPAFAQRYQGHLRRVPPMRVRYGSTPWKGHVSGHAKTWSGRIVITINPKSTLAEVLETILHELTHVSLPADVWHNDSFILRLARAAREAWGLEVPRPLETEANGYVRAYHVDQKIRDELAAKFAADPTSRPALTPAPEEPAPVDLTARRESLVAKRAEHARKMLARNEAKAKSMARRVQLWRAKVRYYDRKIAAKRGQS